MTGHKSLIAVVALAMLSLGSVAALDSGDFSDVTFGDYGCCYAEDPGSAVADPCDGNSCDGNSCDGNPCGCDHGGGQLPRLAAAPLQNRGSAAGAERCEYTPTSSRLVSDQWWVGAESRLTTGPPIHVRHCVWLI